MKKQVIKGWAYPCGGSMFQEQETSFSRFSVSMNGVLLDSEKIIETATIFKYKAGLKRRLECACGNNCKPIKVIITVEEA